MPEKRLIGFNVGTTRRYRPAPGLREQDYNAKRRRRLRFNFPFRPAGGNIDPQIYDLTLSVATTNFEIPIAGNVVKYANSTNVSDLITVRFNRKSAAAVPLRPGDAIDGIAFDRIFVSWAAQSGATASIMLLEDSLEQDVVLT